MRVAIPLFSQVTVLDAVGPYEVLQRVPEIDVVFVGLEPGEVEVEEREAAAARVLPVAARVLEPAQQVDVAAHRVEARAPADCQEPTRNRGVCRRGDLSRAYRGARPARP